MLLAKKIRSLLNGGGTAAGVPGLREAIGMLEAEMEVHRAELGEIPARRGVAALADDAEKELAALTAREDHLYAAIEVAQHRVAALRERLDELTASDRQADFSKRRDAIVEASVVAAAGIRESHEKVAKLIELREAARADGFERDVNAIPLLPHIVNLADPAPALDPFELALDHYQQRKPEVVAVLAARQPSGPKFGSGSYGGTGFSDRHDRAPGSLAHPVVLNEAPASAAGRKLDADRSLPMVTGKDGLSLQRPQTLAPQPPQPPKKQRRLYNEPAGNGKRRVRIDRSDYETPDGRQCRVGDIVALPIEVAQSVVERGAGDFAD